MKKKLFIIILISLICLCVAIISANFTYNINNVKKISPWVHSKITYIDNTYAFTTNSKLIEDIFIPVYQGPNDYKYKSTVPGLYLTIDEFNGPDEPMDVSICWGTVKKRITLDSQSFISWRPLHSGFLYKNIKDQLCYVYIEKKWNRLLFRNQEIKTLNNDHLWGKFPSWSKDGRFFIWPYYTRIDIYEFNSGRVWSSKLLTINDRFQSKTIKCPNKPMQIEMLWDREGRYLWFRLFKDQSRGTWSSDFSVKPLYQGKIDTKQFGLDGH